MTRSGQNLIVWMNGRCVGILAKQRQGGISFEYDPQWLSWPHAIPLSLSLPLRKGAFENSKMLPFLDNLLPDLPQIRQKLAEKTVARGYDTFSLLETMGRDCVGALQFLWENQVPAEANSPVSGRRLGSADINVLLSNLRKRPLGLSDDEEFRLSIAGAQEKTALLFYKNHWHIPHSSTATTHILKPAIGLLADGLDLRDSVDNEYFCMQFVQNLGLPTADTEICSFEDTKVLAIKRFDRLWTSENTLLRLPQEDFCQALSCPPTQKYQADGGPGIMASLELLQGSDTAVEDRETFFKSILVFWLLAAIDGHAKNFSIALYPGGRFKLAPLYDIMSIQPYSDAAQLRKNTISFAMSVGSKPHYKLSVISPRHFAETAALAGLPKLVFPTLIDSLKADVPKALEKTLSRLPLGFPEKLAMSIQSGVLYRLNKL
jgi:serine/threonine-protein kinase HipA